MADDPPDQAPPPIEPSESPPANDDTVKRDELGRIIPKVSEEEVEARYLALHAEHPEWHKTRLAAEIGTNRDFLTKVLHKMEEREKKAAEQAAPTSTQQPAAPEASRPLASDPTVDMAKDKPPADERHFMEPSKAFYTLLDDFRASVSGMKDEQIASLLASMASLRERLPDMGKGDTADKAVAAAFSSNIAKGATHDATWNLALGSTVRQWFVTSGLGAEVENPGELIKTALQFWWDNRDRIPGLERKVQEAQSLLAVLLDEMAPATRRAKARSEIYAMMMVLTMQGRAPDTSTLVLLLRDADAVARDQYLTGDQLMPGSRS